MHRGRAAAKVANAAEQTAARTEAILKIVKRLAASAGVKIDDLVDAAPESNDANSSPATPQQPKAAVTPNPQVKK